MGPALPGSTLGGYRRRLARLVARVAQLDVDAGIVLGSRGRTALRPGARPDPHQFPEPRDLGCLDFDPALAFRSTLEIINGYRLTANDEPPLIRLGKPVVEARDGYTESPSCFLGW